MEQTIRSILAKEKIYLVSPVPLADCRVTRRYLLERAGIAERDGVFEGTVWCFAIPYYVRHTGEPNISCYAWGRDYHAYVKELSARVLPRLTAAFPGNRFAVFADHSPIDERHAAAISGLGILGDNGLVITDDYSSYIFLAEIITDAPTDAVPHEIKKCESCGSCRRACPYHFSACLSELTQRKGELCNEDKAAIRRYNTAWGCDICTEVCPHTHAALARGSIYTPIPFFYERQEVHLTSETVAAMDDEEFALRAYSWRGRGVIMRNLAILEDKHEG